MSLNPLPSVEVKPLVISDPYGVDMAAVTLQTKFSNEDNGLTWLSKSFGRAYIMSRNETVGEDSVEKVYPGIKVLEGYDFLDLLELDNYDAYSFFVARDSESVEDYEDGVRNIYTTTLDCIFWLNLDQVFLQVGHRDTERLKAEIKRQMADAQPYVSSEGRQVLKIDIENVFSEPENIFEGFSFNLVDTQFLHYPYHGFRFELSISYIEDCVS